MKNIIMIIFIAELTISCSDDISVKLEPIETPSKNNQNKINFPTKITIVNLNTYSLQDNQYTFQKVIKKLNKENISSISLFAYGELESMQLLTILEKFRDENFTVSIALSP